MNGIAMIQTANNNNDVVAFALSCREKQTERNGRFIELAEFMMFNFLLYFPDDISEALSMVIKERPKKNTYWDECDIISDAILKVSKEYNEDISLEYCESQRILVGRDLKRYFLYRHPDMKLVSAIVAGGRGLRDTEDNKKQLSISTAEKLAEMIALNDPLCIHSYILSAPMFDHIRQESINEAFALRVEEAVDAICTSNILKFYKDAVLDEQEISGKKVQDVIRDVGIFCSGEFLRYHLK